MKDGWRANFRAMLRLWPSPTPNIRDIVRLDGQVYDEETFLASLGGGTPRKRPQSGRSVRQTLEAIALAGLGYRESRTGRFKLTPLGRKVFSELSTGSADHQLLARMMAAALVEVADYRAILKLVLESGNYITNDELNRAMSRIRSMSDVIPTARRILEARVTRDADSIGAQEYRGIDARKAINPWFLLAGGGGLIISVTGRTRARSIDREVLGSVKLALTGASDTPVDLSNYQHVAIGSGFAGRLSAAGLRAKDAPFPAPPIVMGGPEPPPLGPVVPIPNDPDVSQTIARRIRRGQPLFRSRLLRIYGKRCAITGHGPESVLEAAHIMPHSETGCNRQDNGLLLRADIHDLMDDELLFIEPGTLIVRMDESLRDTPYWELDGKKLRDRSDGSKPSDIYLETQWIKRAERRRG